MDKIETNFPLAENAFSELATRDAKIILSDKFTNSAKRILDTLYIFKKEPLSTSFRRVIGDRILAQPATVQNLTSVLSVLVNEIIKVSPNFREPVAVLPAYKSAAFLQGTILNYTDISSSFSFELLSNRKILQIERLILEQLAPVHVQFTTNQSTLHFLKCSLCALYNILKYCGEEARVEFLSERYTDLILLYNESPIADIKSISSMILAYLLTEEQFNLYMKDESINFIVTNILNNLKQMREPRRVYETTELCLALREMAKNESSHERIIQSDAVIVLATVLKKGTSREKCCAALALLSLSFPSSSSSSSSAAAAVAALGAEVGAQLTTLRNQMPSAIPAEERAVALGPDTIDDYRGLKTWLLERGNLLPEVKAISPVDRRVKTALWMHTIFRRLQWELQLEDEIRERQTMGKGEDPSRSHVMLSYSYVQKSIAHKISRTITDAGFRVWLDVEKLNSENDIMAAMASGVEGAVVVCVLFSEAYKRCPNTRLEAQYAQKLGKPMIFCRVDPSGQPSGWLAALVPYQSYIDFCGKLGFEEASNELLHRVAKFKSVAKGSRPEAVNVKCIGALQTNEISQWDTHEVNSWFKSQGLPIAYSENMSGKDLLFLKKMQSSAPESFFRFLSENWRIGSVPMMRSFAEALERL